MKSRIENYKAFVKGSDERFLKHTLEKCLKSAGFNVIEDIAHQFENYRFTCLWLLGESHLALHTFPENDDSYIELSSCIDHKGEIFAEKLKEVVGEGLFLEVIEDNGVVKKQ